VRSKAYLAALGQLCLLSLLGLSIQVRAQAQAGLPDISVNHGPPRSAGMAPRSLDPLHLELALRHELGLIRTEEARLLQLDRQAQPLTAAKTATFLGFGVATVPLLIALHRDGEPSGQAPSAQERRTSRIVGGVMIAGVVTGFTGLGFLLYKVRHRPHRTEALALRDRRRSLEQDLKRVVREQEEGPVLSGALSLTERHATLVLRCSF